MLEFAILAGRALIGAFILFTLYCLIRLTAPMFVAKRAYIYAYFAFYGILMTCLQMFPSSLPSIAINWVSGVGFVLCVAGLAISVASTSQMFGRKPTADHTKYMRKLDMNSRNPVVVFKEMDRGVAIILILSSLAFGLNWIWIGLFTLGRLQISTAMIHRPPFAILLAASAPEKALLQNRIRKACVPYAVSSLLNIEGNGTFQIGMTQQGMHRTRDDDAWRLIVDELTYISKVIVMDTSISSTYVLEEARRIVGSSLAFKTLFLLDENGNCPVLDAAGVKRNELEADGAALLREEDALAVLKYMRLDRSRTPTVDRPISTCTRVALGQETKPETTATT